MCRASNTSTIRLQHMNWFADALCILFAHQKNDQDGSRPRDPRHVYANPLNPEICPILSLGIYFLCTTFTDASAALFPGTDQYDRYQKGLKRLFARPPVASRLEVMSIDPRHLGSHSTRKGATSYCASGSTACPSSTAVCLRAGWSLQGVQDRYLRYEAAGDQHVGRTVCGLPTDDPDFALLPPHFIEHNDVVKEALAACFPRAPKELGRVLEFCLASLVYHRDFIRATVPKRHAIYSTPLFAARGLPDSLAKFVTLAPTGGLRPTGIPPQVAVLSSQRHLAQQFAATNNLLLDYTSRVEAISTGGSCSLEGMRRVMQEVLDERQQQLRLSQTAADAAAGAGAASAAGGQQPVAWWDGRPQLVPKDFAFPQTTAQTAFIMYVCGNAELRYPPLRSLRPADLPTKALKKRLCDFLYLMERLKKRLRH